MIESIKILDGYAAKLPALQQKLKFTPGINILFGPNGCGKTSALKIMGAYCGILHGGGWSRHPAPGDVTDFSVKGVKLKKFPHAFAQRGCTADVKWDGTPTFFNTAGGENLLAHFFVNDPSESADGITTIEEQMAGIFHHPSAGQARIYKLAKIVALLKQQPDLTKTPGKRVNSLWSEAWEAFSEYVKTLSRTGPSTLLLDEPDLSLSLSNQILLWDRVVPRLAEQCQVVASTHSPFVLSKPWNFIDLDPGYLGASRKQVREWAVEFSKTAGIVESRGD